MERMTPTDANFLQLEDEISAMHSISVATFEGPEPDFGEVLARAAERVELVPRFRQRFLRIPLEIERPVWVNDPHFRIGYHIRHTAIPEPTEEALFHLVGRILSQRLDRGKPLWEMWVVSNLPDDRWAIVSKAHHSIIDGVSGIDPISMMIDGITSSPLIEPWETLPLPSRKELIESAAVHLATSPKEAFRLAKRVVSVPNRAIDWARSVQGGSTTSAHRGWAAVHIPYETVRARRTELGVTTNTTLLTYIALGLRGLNESGEIPHWPNKSIHTHIPYAVGPGGVFTNEVASMATMLPLYSDDFETVARAISSQVAPTKTTHSVSAKKMTKRPGLPAPTIAALGIRRIAGDAMVETGPSAVAVNAPGPRESVRVLGHEMTCLAPALPLSAKSQISVGIISYVGEFNLGITTDLHSELSSEIVANSIKAVDD